MLYGRGRGCLLGLQKQFLVEGLVLVAPFVSAAPTRVAAVSDATGPSSGLEGEVQQVVQAYFLRSSELSRAKLGPARLCYLRRQREGGKNPSKWSLTSICRSASFLDLFLGKNQPPRVVLHLQLHTVVRLSERVSCQNSCLSVNWCGEAPGKCRF